MKPRPTRFTRNAMRTAPGLMAPGPPLQHVEGSQGWAAARARAAAAGRRKGRRQQGRFHASVVLRGGHGACPSFLHS
jgi:hypothetical protein